MTNEEAISLGAQILNVFPVELTYNDVHWVLKGLIESVQDAMVEECQLTPDITACKPCSFLDNCLIARKGTPQKPVDNNSHLN